MYDGFELLALTFIWFALMNANSKLNTIIELLKKNGKKGINN